MNPHDPATTLPSTTPPMIVPHTEPDVKMERRKIQLSGRTTFVVSLPKNWVQAANLEAGDSVGIDVQDDGTLVIVPESVRRRHTTAEIECTGLDGDSLLRELMAAYTAGFDLLNVRSKTGLTPEQRAAVKRMTAMTVGFEVVEEVDRGLVLQDMVDPTQFASRGGLQRLARIVSAMLRDVLQAIESEDQELAEDVIQRDDNVDRMYLMISKQHVQLLSDISMARRKQVTLKESLFLAQSARALERCGDHAARIAYAMREANDPERSFFPETWNRVRALGDEALDLMQRAVNAFMKTDPAAAHAVIARSEELTRERGLLTKALLDAGEHEILFLGLIVESLERVHQYAADIAEAALSHSAAVRALETPTAKRNR